MDFFDMTHTCSLINLPLCKILKSKATPFTSRGITIFKTYIPSVPTLSLIMIEILGTIRMIINTNQNYSGIGRKEMVLFFYNYLFLNIFEFLLISEIVLNYSLYFYKLAICIELSLLNSCFFCLFLGSILSMSFIKFKLIDSLNMLRIFTLFYFLGCFGIFYIFLELQNGLLIFISLIGVNLIISCFYYFTQLLE